MKYNFWSNDSALIPNSYSLDILQRMVPFMISKSRLREKLGLMLTVNMPKRTKRQLIASLPSQFWFRKGFRTCDALLISSHYLHFSLDCELEFHLFTINFSSNFDMQNHRYLIHKLKFFSIGDQQLNFFWVLLKDLSVS